MAGARVLGDGDVAEALALCARDPVATVLAASRLEIAAIHGLRAAGGELWGFAPDGPLEAVCWVGANLVPVVPGVADLDRTLDAFASLARSRSARCSSLVGEADATVGLWNRLEGRWGRPREVRAEQPSLVLDTDPLVEPDPHVRRASLADLDLVLPACVRMFTEEVGYSPVSDPTALRTSPPFGPYEARVRSLVVDRRSFVRRDGDRVVFKAELGAVARGVAQVQGVWVDPELRGRGLAAPGMAAVVALTRAGVAPVVSLYVNSYNERALATYRRVGFRRVGTFATILL